MVGVVVNSSLRCSVRQVFPYVLPDRFVRSVWVWWSPSIYRMQSVAAWGGYSGNGRVMAFLYSLCCLLTHVEGDLE